MDMQAEQDKVQQHEVNETKEEQKSEGVLKEEIQAEKEDELKEEVQGGRDDNKKENEEAKVKPLENKSIKQKVIETPLKKRQSISHPLNQESSTLDLNLSLYLKEESVGKSIINWILEKKLVFSQDIIALMKMDKAMLLLPVCTDKVNINRNFIEDYIVLCNQLKPLISVTTISFLSVMAKDDKLYAFDTDTIPPNKLIKMLNDNVDLNGNIIIKQLDDVVIDDFKCKVIIIEHLLKPCDLNNKPNLPPRPKSINEVLEANKIKEITSEEWHGIVNECEQLIEYFDNNEMELKMVVDKLHFTYDIISKVLLKYHCDSQLVEALEGYVCDRYYHKLFQPHDSDDVNLDNQFESKLKMIQKDETIMTTFKSNLEDEQDINYELYIKDLSTINNKLSCKDKVNILIEFNKKFGNDLSIDVILPKLIFALAHIEDNINLIANIRFIQRFRYQLDGTMNYSITNLLAAISYIESKVDNETKNNNENNNNSHGIITSLKTLSAMPLEITGEGVKTIVGVMDSMVGRFWYPTNNNNQPIIKEEQVKEMVKVQSDLKDFKKVDKSFEQCTIQDLHDVYNKYNLLLDMVQSKNI